jgi:hypothetical protein
MDTWASRVGNIWEGPPKIGGRKRRKRNRPAILDTTTSGFSGQCFFSHRRPQHSTK